MTTLRLRSALVLAALALSACHSAADDRDTLSRQAVETAAQCSAMRTEYLVAEIEQSNGLGNGPTPLAETLVNASCKLAADVALEDANARMRAMIDGAAR